MFNQFDAFRVSTFTQSLSVTSVMNTRHTPVNAQYTFMLFYCISLSVGHIPYAWSVGNSQRAVDNVQTVAKPLFKQHEDF